MVNSNSSSRNILTTISMHNATSHSLSYSYFNLTLNLFTILVHCISRQIQSLLSLIIDSLLITWLPNRLIKKCFPCWCINLSLILQGLHRQPFGPFQVVNAHTIRIVWTAVPAATTRRLANTFVSKWKTPLRKLYLLYLVLVILFMFDAFLFCVYFLT